MMKNHGFVAAAMLLASTTTPASAAIVVDQQNTGTSFVSPYTTTQGQSFTAALNGINFASAFLANDLSTPASVRLDLLSGVGYAGTVLASTAARSFNLNGFYQFNFNSIVSLTVGQAYTLRFTAETGQFYTRGTTENKYTRGSYINGGSPDQSIDLAFFEGIETFAAVPEPATWVMMLAGFAMVAGTIRYRRRRTATTFA